MRRTLTFFPSRYHEIRLIQCFRFVSTCYNFAQFCTLYIWTQISLSIFCFLMHFRLGRTSSFKPNQECSVWMNTCLYGSNWWLLEVSLAISSFFCWQIPIVSPCKKEKERKTNLDPPFLVVMLTFMPTRYWLFFRLIMKTILDRIYKWISLFRFWDLRKWCI